jgi:hypothetical protein
LAPDDGLQDFLCLIKSVLLNERLGDGERVENGLIVKDASYLMKLETFAPEKLFSDPRNRDVCGCGLDDLEHMAVNEASGKIHLVVVGDNNNCLCVAGTKTRLKKIVQK